MARARDAVNLEEPFRMGDTVRVQYRFPIRGHVRAPYYLRGKIGKIAHCYGVFQNPELLAEGDRNGAPVFLYQVHFSYDSVWRDRPNDRSTVVAADLYEDWLERVTVEP